MLTGSDVNGQLYKTDLSQTCQDWTSSVDTDGKPRVGHSWPRDFRGFNGVQGGFPDGGFPDFSGFGPGGFMPPENFDGVNWISSLNEAGCAAGASLVEMGLPNAANPSVGSGGGYGGFYCFALTP